MTMSTRSDGSAMRHQENDLHWVEDGPGRSAVTTSRGTRLAEYRWGPERNHPYIDGMRPLNHAGVLTNHAPWDHRWHHGLWWSWKFVNLVLFWEDHPDYGGNQVGLGHSTVTEHRPADATDRRCGLAQRLVWTVDDSGEELLTERRCLRLAIVSVGDRPAWSIDWDLCWTAATDLRFGTTPYPEVPWGGYGGLSFRPARSLAAGERILADDHRQGKDRVHAERSAWAAYVGRVDGATDDHPAEPATGGLAILQHPDNPRYPEPWYAATAEQEFGFLGAAPLLAEDLRIARGETLRLRYRTVVLGHVPEHGELAETHVRYVEQSRVDEETDGS